MNKIQHFILDNWDSVRGTMKTNFHRSPLSKNERDEFFMCVSKKSRVILANDFDYGSDCYTLIQEEDIFSIQYEFVLKANVNIASCSYFLDGEWKEASKKGESNFYVLLDMEHRVEQIKIVFRDNLADAYVFRVGYVEADKELYYQKQEEKKKAERVAAAQIKHSTGLDLVNIYFQPCCSDYEYTEIYLYIPQDYETVGGPYGPVKKPSSWQLFKKCKVSSEDFYKSISGLAYGTYAYVVKQFDKKGDLLLETEYIEFSLKAPRQPIMGRINRA